MSDLNPNTYDNSSITLATAKEVLIAKFDGVIATLPSDSQLPVILENQETDSPDNGYIQFTIRMAGSLKDGRGSYDNTGLATADIYVPLGSGWGITDSIHEAIEASFVDARWKLNVMSIISVQPNTIGKSGSFYHTQVDIAFRYHHKV